MAKKKKQKFPRPRKNILVAAAIALALGAGYLAYYLAHQHAIAADKARFTAAQKDVATIANQVEAAVGPPQDRRDGGKCSYAHPEKLKGAITCEVYTYMGYGVDGTDGINAIVKKVEPLNALHTTPWQFRATIEKPHQFVNGVVYFDSFVNLDNLFDTETKTNSYYDLNVNAQCAINFNYHNAVAQVAGYPNLNISSVQAAYIYLHCAMPAKNAYFPIT